MVRELITCFGETDGTSTTGDFSLDSDLFQATVNYIRISKGMKAKYGARESLDKHAQLSISILRMLLQPHQLGKKLTLSIWLLKEN